MKQTNADRDNKTLVLALLRSQQVFMRAMTPMFKTANLTAPQWDVLETLSTKGETSVNDLIKLTLSTSGSLDVVVKNLIQAGLIEKTIGKTDRRSRILRLTPAGQQMVEEFLPTHNRFLDDMFKHLSRDEKRNIIITLNTLRKKILRSQKERNHDE